MRREHLPPKINKKMDYRYKLKQIKWQVRHYSPNLQEEEHTLYNRAKKEADQALKEYTEKGWLDKIQDPNDKRLQMWCIQHKMKKPNYQT
ncbi:hypothetical protein EVAR_78132_1 [Eumeta japonica]|uniref:Uncharacterized protein n=1 Tax=Eumeta variegata TaxID=151549 RepID=A0A4C1T0N1_EUMVA|nr:hypothetical protein EVAR_78132_1 [Eumeta japonica]